jgi:hypothetical protein
VALTWKLPNIWAYAESFGLIRDVRSRLRARLKTAPEAQREAGIASNQGGQEIVFKGPNGPFSCILVMHMGPVERLHPHHA